MKKFKNKISIFAVAIMAFGFMSCDNDGKDIIVNEVDYNQVFLNAFEEKLSLLFQTAEVSLRTNPHQDFKHLFKNAYVEVLGNYADVITFENAFLEMSQETSFLRTRSFEETTFSNLTNAVINSSENLGVAIGKFDALASDASLTIEDRVGFVGMREFLTFYESNEEAIMFIILEESFDEFDEFDRLPTDEFISRISWKCVTGVLGDAMIYGLGGCVGGATVGGLIGTAGGPKGIAAGAAKGCKIGGTIGAVSGAFRGINNHC